MSNIRVVQYSVPDAVRTIITRNYTIFQCLKMKIIKYQALAEKIKFEVEGRPKHLYSIYNKMMTRGKPFDEIYDMFAVRIILETDDHNDCFTVYGIISGIYKKIPEEGLAAEAAEKVR